MSELRQQVMRKGKRRDETEDMVLGSMKGSMDKIVKIIPSTSGNPDQDELAIVPFVEHTDFTMEDHVSAENNVDVDMNDLAILCI
ncbi:hypothetical protein EJB05_13511 [Eragrostis curvula]|uniref:Uncharacterized protein n=1 Tax=Eragrostis curvula TaxID=38414 RepID=A0A5J9VWG3_9POAL|nr:hypothetical protein EJB05_13511 [Eragrostis curvula]